MDKANCMPPSALHLRDLLQGDHAMAASIIIKRCPTCASIRSRADELRESLRKELGITPRIEDGASGELSLFVDGVPMIQRTGDSLPSDEEIEAAVRNARPTA